MKNLLRTALCLSVAVTTAFTLSGCGGGSDSSSSSSDAAGSTLRVAYEGAPDSWAPGADVGNGFLLQSYETLVRYDQNLEIHPFLATEWTQTDTELTLKLKEGVKFHDGTPFDAEAVKANIEFVKDQAGPFSSGYNAVSSVEVVDPQTVTLRLSEPNASLLSTLAQRGGLMASPKAIESGEVLQKPVGTGPWAYNDSETQPGTLWVFDRFDDYWGEKPAIDRLEMRGMDDGRSRLSALQAGQLDIADLDVSLADQVEAAGLEYTTFPALHYGLIFFDRGPGGVFEDVNVRRAVCSAMNTSDLAAAGGQVGWDPMTQRVSEGQYSFNPTIKPLELDPAVAQTLQGKNLSASVAVFESNRFLGEAAAGELGKYGFNLNVEQIDAGQYFDEWNSGRWPMGFGDNSEVHPQEWYQTWFAANAPANSSKVESPELAAAAAKATALGTTPESEQAWAEVMKIIDDEALICKHMSLESALVWNPDKLDVPDPTYWPRYGQYTEMSIKS